MAAYFTRRILMTIPTVIFISFLSFFIIELPPGDFVTAYVANARYTGEVVSQSTIDYLRELYRLDDPVYVRYWAWITRIITEGDFGRSATFNAPVSEIIWERLSLTLVVTGMTILFTWALAIPIGIFSAVKQYSIGDYIFTFLGFLGKGIPDFLLALIVIWIAFAYFGADLTGLFSPEFANAPWSFDKLLDMLKHIWVPVVVIGTGATAGGIRTMRANTLDELNKPYVDTARAKGVSEVRMILKYPVRVALNPFFSSIGFVLPQLVSGSIIVAFVLQLPTSGPVLLNALTAQDMYLAGSFIFILSVLTVIGTLISDLLLAWVDPRIRYA